jgi:hypothetical protein
LDNLFFWVVFNQSGRFTWDGITEFDWNYECRYSITKACCIAFVMTFFFVFDVPVFWPILLIYWVMLFLLTMRRQISHMIKYRYVPFSTGKQVSLYLTSCFIYLFIFFFCGSDFLVLILVICSCLSAIWWKEGTFHRNCWSI